MSFYGKKFQKSAADNMAELMTAMKVDEKVAKLFSRPESLTSFLKNDDGSIQHVVEIEGNKVFDHQILLGQESDMPTPDGLTVKYVASLDGNTLNVWVTKDGHKVLLERKFEDDKLTMTIQPEGVDIKGSITYKAVA